MNYIDKKERALSQGEVAPQIHDQSLDLSGEFEAVEGRVSEIAKEGVSEDRSQSAQSSAQGEEELLQRKATLRETLLESAPSEREMRKEVLGKLSEQKTALLKKFAGIDSRNFNLLEDTLRELRKVIRTMQLAAVSSLEALQEMWLQIVHKLL
ncbi:hypothetical protein HY463_01410 [Candidatus Peregrinibacteria bacterium]|nr:hypothetical protein [Candidatus Peregrinibacteria bacterium]